jgi:peptide/nickel transport system substrate-binding protein
VRQALNYAVDKEALVKHLLFGFGTPSGQALPIMFGYDPAIKPYPHDPARARALLKQAGYPHGFSLQMLIGTGSAEAREVATVLQQDFAQIGVTLSLQTLEVTTLDSIIAGPAHDYELALGYMSSDIVDPDELVTFAMAGDGGTQALWTLYNNPTVNRLAHQAAATTDRKARQRLYYQLDRLHHDDAPMIFLASARSVTLTTAAVQGFKVLPTGNYRLEECWFSS